MCLCLLFSHPKCLFILFIAFLLPVAGQWHLVTPVPCWALLAGWWSSPFGLVEEEVLSDRALRYQHGYRFFNHFQVECWQVWTGRWKECVSLPQVREPSLVTHLCFTVSISLAVLVLVSLTCKCYCCSWECFKWNKCFNSLSWLCGFFCLFVF